jgi:hypothetical protein
LHLVAHSPSSLIGGWNCCTVIHQPWLVSSCNWSTHLRSAVRIKVNWLKFDLFIDKNYPLLLEDLFDPSAREFFDINLLLSFKLFLFIFNIRRLTDVKLTSVQLGRRFRNKRFERYWASNRFIVLICVLRAANRYFGLFLFLLIVISNDKLLFNIRGGTRCSGGTDTDPACSDPTVSDIVSFANDGIVGSQLKELLLLLVLEAEFFKDCRSYFYDIICCWGLWAVFFTQSIVDYFSHGRSIFILVDILWDPLERIDSFLLLRRMLSDLHFKLTYFTRFLRFFLGGNLLRCFQGSQLGQQLVVIVLLNTGSDVLWVVSLEVDGWRLGNAAHDCW